MNYSFLYCDLNNGQKVHYSGYGLNNGIVKVRNSNGSVNRMSGILILTVFINFKSETSLVHFSRCVLSVLRYIYIIHKNWLDTNWGYLLISFASKIYPQGDIVTNWWPFVCCKLADFR